MKTEKNLGEIKNYIKTHPIIYVLLAMGIICLILASSLVYSTFHKVHHRPFPIPRQTNVQLIQDWMTLPYISHIYGVPEPELFKGLGLDPEQTKTTSIQKLAKKNNISSADFIKKVQTIITDFQATHPTPPPTPTGPQ